MRYLENINTVGQDADSIQDHVLECHELIKQWRGVLQYIAENRVYVEIPTDGADYEELGRYIYPDRIKMLADMSRDVLGA